MKKIFFLVLVSTLVGNLFAQENTTKPQTHHIGIFASSGSGSGLSYRYWPNKLGVQVTTLPIFNRNGGHDINIGANLLYTIQRHKFIDLYAFLGNEFINSRIKYSMYDEFGNLTQIDETYNRYNASLGLGLKINFLEVLDISTQAGYGVFNINNSPYTNISAGIGLYYHL